MSVVHFQCPACQAPLRLENRALFVGRNFDCPDCSESLLIEADGSAGVIAKQSSTPTRRASEATGSNAVTSSAASRTRVEAVSKISDLGVDLQSPKSAWDRLSRRPALLGWIVAALLAVLLLVVVNSGRQRGLPESNAPNVSENNRPDAAQQNDEPNSKTAVGPDPIPSESNDKSPAAVTVNEAVKPEVKSEPPQPDVTKDSPRASKPPAEATPAGKPTLEEPKPVAVPPPPEPAPVTQALSSAAIEVKLRQKIARFDQSKPIAFVKLLDTVEELAGVPIVWDLDRVTDEQLQKLVTVRLKETTVGEILDTLLKQVGLERRTIEGKIELLPAVSKD